MPGVIWIASYPKSGNTWVRLFLAALELGRDVDLTRMAGTAGIASSRALLEQYLDVCLGDMTPDEVADLRPLAYQAMAAAETSRPAVLKVHDCYGRTPSGGLLFPPETTNCCIHLVRDPRDVCLSLAAHSTISIDEAITVLGDAAYIAGASVASLIAERWGSWSSHCESWLAAPLRRLTVRYEDMLADAATVLGGIARFRGLEVTYAAVAEAVWRTSFTRLADAEAGRGFRERPFGMERFFRAGLAGQWREKLTKEQVARIERDHAPMMARLGYHLAGDGAEAAEAPPDPLSRSLPHATGGNR